MYGMRKWLRIQLLSHDLVERATTQRGYSACMKRAANTTDMIELPDRASWRGWLEANHETSRGVWLAVGKKGNPVTALSYNDAVEEAVCFGWIDSTVNRLDKNRFKQRFSPRRSDSGWAPSNKKRVERLMRAGLMTPAGLATIMTAKSNGSWMLLDDVENLVIPDDLATALTDNAAGRAFSSLETSRQKQLLYWIATGKRAETRARRIAAAVAEALGTPLES